MANTKNGIPPAAPVPTYDPMARPWTSHEDTETEKNDKD